MPLGDAFRPRRACANDIDDFEGTALLLDCRSAAPQPATHAAHPRPPGTLRIARRHGGVRPRPGARPSAGNGGRSDAGHWRHGRRIGGALWRDPADGLAARADPARRARRRSRSSVLARRRSGDTHGRAQRRPARRHRRGSVAHRRRRAGRDAERAFCERRSRVRRTSARCVLRPRRDEDATRRHIRQARHWAALFTSCSPRAPTPVPGGAGNRKSRCCCTSIRSTSSANARGMRRRTAYGSPAAERCRNRPCPRFRRARSPWQATAAALAAHVGSRARALPSASRRRARGCRRRGNDGGRARICARRRLTRAFMGRASAGRARQRRARRR